jgi:ribosomal protein L24E
MTWHGKAWRLPQDKDVEDTAPVTFSKASCNRLAFFLHAATVSQKDFREEPSMSAQRVIFRRHMSSDVGYNFWELKCRSLRYRGHGRRIEDENGAHIKGTSPKSAEMPSSISSGLGAYVRKDARIIKIRSNKQLRFTPHRQVHRSKSWSDVCKAALCKVQRSFILGGTD